MNTLHSYFLNSTEIKNGSFNPNLDQHELMFLHTSLSKEIINDWMRKTNPGFAWVFLHILWTKIDTILGNKLLIFFATASILLVSLLLRFKSKNQIGEVFMKDIIDALIFNHEVKIGRISSINSLRSHLDSDKFAKLDDSEEDKMSFFEKINAPTKPVNLIKLLSVIQESRLKDIQAQMDEKDDPFMAKSIQKNKTHSPEPYNFVNDLLKFEHNLQARKK